jgi:hypothetical protein
MVTVIYVNIFDTRDYNLAQQYSNYVMMIYKCICKPIGTHYIHVLASIRKLSDVGMYMPGASDAFVDK